MPRTRTDAAERANQRRDVADQVSAELGRPVGIREAARHRRVTSNMPAPGSDTGFIVNDRQIQFDPADARRIGQVLGRVLDLKILNSGYGTVTVQVGAEYWHTIVDSAHLSRGHPLLLTLDELHPINQKDSYHAG